MSKLEKHFERAHEAGLGVTLHIAEIQVRFSYRDDLTFTDLGIR
jgi:hypothetical protein